VKGVLVEQVESAGWAGLAGVQIGDLIQRINQHQITDLNSYRRAMKEVSATQPKRVVILVLRGARTHFQYVEPEWKPDTTDQETATKPASQPAKE
jgi:S1-C subfamily serine protease